MRRLPRLIVTALFTAVLAAPVAFADTAKPQAAIAIKADVQAAAQTDASAGDAAAAAGDFEGALNAYAQGFAKSRDAAFVYAMAQAHKQLGHTAEAKAMFELYLAASGNATLAYEEQARTELGLKAAAGKVKKVAFKAGAGVYAAAKVAVAKKVKSAARADAKAADEAYAAAKYDDAAKGYATAYEKTEQALLLYASAQAHAQAGHATDARALLAGYLATKPKQNAKDAKQLFFALGGSNSGIVKLAVKAKASKKAKTLAGKGDKAFKAGKYRSAAKAYADAYAQAPDEILLYAKGMAEYYGGMTAEADASMKSYVEADASSAGEFEPKAREIARACGGAWAKD